MYLKRILIKFILNKKKKTMKLPINYKRNLARQDRYQKKFASLRHIEDFF